MTEARASHPYHMYEAIRAQPATVERALRQARAERAAEMMARRPRLLFAGIGTSLHAAMVAGQFLRHLTEGNLRVEVGQSFELAKYPCALGPDDALCIITHTGTTQANVELLRQANVARALTIALCGENCGEGMRQAEVLLTTCEQESSFTYTKSYTAALAVLAQLCIGIAERRGYAAAGARGELSRIPELISQAMETEAGAREIAVQMGAFERIAVFGAGPNWATACEAALKIKESSYRAAEGFETEQILHGPFSSMDSRTALVGLFAGGKGDERGKMVLGAGRELEMLRIAIGDAESCGDAEGARALLVPGVAEWLSPLVQVVPLQWLAYHLAMERGSNPDTGRMEQPAHARAQGHYKY